MKHQKILALGDYTNYKYHPFQDVSVQLKETLSKHGFEVHCTEDRSELHIESLSEYDACLSYVDAWESTLIPVQMDGLLQFVDSGKGFLALHCGISYENAEYRSLLGASFVSHPPYQTLSIRIKDKAHPITADLSDFELRDELYIFEFVEFHRLNVLMECQFEVQSYPIAWTRTYGEGRIVYLALGHSVESFRNEMFLKLVANSVLWVAGRS